MCDIFVSVLNTEMVQKVEGDEMYCPKEATYGRRPGFSLSKHRAKRNESSDVHPFLDELKEHWGATPKWFVRTEFTSFF